MSEPKKNLEFKFPLGFDKVLDKKDIQKSREIIKQHIGEIAIVQCSSTIQTTPYLIGILQPNNSDSYFLNQSDNTQKKLWYEDTQEIFVPHYQGKTIEIMVLDKS